MAARFSWVFKIIILGLVMANSVAKAAEPDRVIDSSLASMCDPGIDLTGDDRVRLLNKLRISKAGRDVLEAFTNQYGTLSKLLIQWDSVSYSQVAKPEPGRAVAAATATGRLGVGICVHLARNLPEIENIADLAHELTHATRLEPQILRGEVEDVDVFVRERLAAQGGEADAFAVECQVKREILGKWDGFCNPYANEKGIDVKRVVADLYTGELSASLTGEAYPVMLARQYRAMLAKRAARQVRDVKYSALENKSASQ